MATIITRVGKGSPLTFAELDANFTNLNNDKLERNGSIAMTGNLNLGGFSITNAAAGTFSGTVTAAVFSGSGASLTALNGAQVTTGTIPVARLNGGTSAQFVRGDGNYASSLSNAASTTVLTVQNTQAGQFGEFYVSSNDRSFGMGVRSSTNAGGELAYLIANNAATPISIIAGGSERIRVAPAGNVSINAPSSGRPLQITNINTQLNVSLIGRPADGAAGIAFRNNVDTVENAAIIGANGADRLQFWTAATQRVVVSDTGNVTVVAPSIGNALTIFGASTYTPLALFQGTVGTQQVLTTLGWNNSVQRWNWVIETNASLAAYSYDTLGSNARPTITIANAGNVTIAAPDAGIAFAANAFSGITPAIQAVSATANAYFSAISSGVREYCFGVDRTNDRFIISTGSNLTSPQLILTPGGVHSTVSDAGTVEIGFRGIPQNSQGGNYTLVAADRGRHIAATGGSSTITVPASVFSIGDAITIVNATTGNITVAQGASTTLRQAGTTNTGNRTLAVRGVCTVICVGTNDFYISGAGLS